MKITVIALATAFFWMWLSGSDLDLQVDVSIGKMEWKAKDDIPFDKGQGYPASLAFTPDSEDLIAGGGKTVTVFDVRTGKKKAEFQPWPGGAIHSIALSPNGQLLAIGGTGLKSIIVWDFLKKKELFRLTGHAVSTHELSFSQDGKALVSWGDEKMPNSDKLFRSSDYGVRFWNLENRAELAGFVGGLESRSAGAIAPDGKTVAVGNFVGEITIMEVGTGKVKRTFSDEESDSGRGIRALAFSPDGKLLASGKGRTVCLYDPDSGRIVKLLSRAWQDSGTGKELPNPKTALHDSMQIAVSPDGRWLASAGLDPRIKLWELQPSMRK